MCSGSAGSLLAAGAGGRFCLIWIRIELLSNNFSYGGGKVVAYWPVFCMQL